MAEIPHIVGPIAILKPKPGNTNTDVEPSALFTPITEGAAKQAGLLSQLPFNKAANAIRQAE